MAHRVTRTLMKSPCGKLSNKAKIHLLASGSVLSSTTSTSLGSSNAHAHLAILQWMSECCQESFDPQSSHDVDTNMLQWCLKSAVDNDYCANLHRKILTFEGTSDFP